MSLSQEAKTILRRKRNAYFYLFGNTMIIAYLFSGIIILVMFRGAYVARNIKLAVIGFCLALMPPMFISHRLSSTNKKEIRSQLKRDLNSLDASAVVILLDMDTVRAIKANLVIDALAKTEEVTPHHSAAGISHKLMVADSLNYVELAVARDGARREEYWVYYKGSYIGRVQTKVFAFLQ